MTPDINQNLKDLIADEILSGNKVAALQKKYKVSASYIYNVLFEKGIKYNQLLEERRIRLRDQNFQNVLQLYEQLGRIPTIDEIKKILLTGERPGIYLDLLHRHFGTGPYGEEKKLSTKIRARTKEDLIDDLKRIANLVGKTPSSRNIKDHSIYEYKDYFKFFDSYQAAIKEARLNDVKRKKKVNHSKNQKQSELINYFLEKTRELERLPTKKDLQDDEKHNYMEYYRVFGSYKNAIIESGLAEIVNKQKKPADFLKEINSFLTNQQLVEFLLMLADKYGRPPKVTDLKLENKYSAIIFRKRFGSWRNALKSAGISTSIYTKKKTHLDKVDILKWVANYISNHENAPARNKIIKKFKIHNEIFQSMFGSYKNLLFQAGELNGKS